MVDYSKWDKMDLGSDSEDEVMTDGFNAAEDKTSGMMQGHPLFNTSMEEIEKMEQQVSTYPLHRRRRRRRHYLTTATATATAAATTSPLPPPPPPPPLHH